MIQKEQFNDSVTFTRDQKKNKNLHTLPYVFGFVGKNVSYISFSTICFEFIHHSYFSGVLF